MSRQGTKLGNESLQCYQRMLQAKEAELKEALVSNYLRLAEATKGVDVNVAVLMQEETLTLRTNQILYSMLKQVAEALGRLDRGEYGSCLGCGDSIEAERLQAIPWSKFCSFCHREVGPIPHRPQRTGATEESMNHEACIYGEETGINNQTEECDTTYC